MDSPDEKTLMLSRRVFERFGHFIELSRPVNPLPYLICPEYRFAQGAANSFFVHPFQSNILSVVRSYCLLFLFPGDFNIPSVSQQLILRFHSLL